MSQPNEAELIEMWFEKKDHNQISFPYHFELQIRGKVWIYYSPIDNDFMLQTGSYDKSYYRINIESKQDIETLIRLFTKQ